LLHKYLQKRKKYKGKKEQEDAEFVVFDKIRREL